MRWGDKARGTGGCDRRWGAVACAGESEERLKGWVVVGTWFGIPVALQGIRHLLA